MVNKIQNARETVDDFEDGEIGEQQLCGDDDDGDDNAFDSLGGVGPGAGKGIGLPGGAIADEDDHECDRDLIVEFLDPGPKGASILLRHTATEDCGCDEKTMLIDTGRNRNDNELVNKLEDRDVEEIDHLVLTHNHTDHYGGLLLTSSGGLLDAHENNNIEIEKIYHNGIYQKDTYPTTPDRSNKTNAKSTQNTLEAELGGLSNSIPTELLTEGDGHKLPMGNGIDIEVLNPPANPRNGTVCDLRPDCNSIVLEVTKQANEGTGSASFLFSSDIRRDLESEMSAQDKLNEVDVLQLAHHAGADSNGEDLLDDTDPHHVVFTGGDNDIGIPSHTRDLISGIPYYSTYQTGDIKFVVEEDGDIDSGQETVIPN